MVRATFGILKKPRIIFKGDYITKNSKNLLTQRGDPSLLQSMIFYQVLFSKSEIRALNECDFRTLRNNTRRMVYHLHGNSKNKSGAQTSTGAQTVALNRWRSNVGAQTLPTAIMLWYGSTTTFGHQMEKWLRAILKLI